MFYLTSILIGKNNYCKEDFKENVIPVDDCKLLQFDGFLLNLEKKQEPGDFRDEFFKRISELVEQQKLSVVCEAFPLYVKYLLRARNQKMDSLSMQDILSVIDSTSKQYYRLKFEVQTSAALKIQVNTYTHVLWFRYFMFYLFLVLVEACKCKITTSEKNEVDC